MKAFIGRFTRSASFLLADPGPPVEPGFEEPELEQEWLPDRRESDRKEGGQRTEGGRGSGSEQTSRLICYSRLLDPADPCVWWWEGMPCVEFGVDEGVGGVMTDRGACG